MNSWRNSSVLIMLAAIVLASNASALVAPQDASKDKLYRTAEKSAALAGQKPDVAEIGTKVCSVFVPGNWRDSVNVGPRFTKQACYEYVVLVGAHHYQLGCLYANGIGLGQPGGGLPAQNCGW